MSPQSVRALIFTHLVGRDCCVIETAHDVADGIMRDLWGSGYRIKQVDRDLPTADDVRGIIESD